MSTPGDNEQDDAPPVQRVISAVDASPLFTKAASSVFSSWRRAGVHVDSTASLEEPQAPSAEPTTETGSGTAAAAPTPQGEPMAKRNGAARARKSRNGSPQLQICSLLLHNALQRDAIAASLPDLTAAQISSALHTAKNADRVKWNDAAGVYQLTKTGRAWVEAAGGGQQPEGDEKPQRTARTAAVHRRGRRASEPAPQPAAVDTSPAAGQPRTFRCAVFSDGGFFLAKGDQRIELDAGEHAEMLAYLERMAEDQTA